jgi:hypothetical protein
MHLGLFDVGCFLLTTPFDAVQASKAARSSDYPAKQRKAKRLLSGLLKCHKCGGGISVKDRDHGRIRVHCSTRRESGSCDNKKIYYLDQIETAVLSGLQKHLKSPELLAEFVDTYQKERIRLAADKQKARLNLENNLARTQRSIDRIWSEYEDELIDMKIAGPKLRLLSEEKEALEVQLDTMEPEPNVISLHPTAIKRYQEFVANLSAAFDDGISTDNEEAAFAIRNLVQKIVVGHNESGQLMLSVHGHLAALTDAPNLYPDMRVSASRGPMVAGDRYRLSPPTENTAVFVFEVWSTPRLP